MTENFDAEQQATAPPPDPTAEAPAPLPVPVPVPTPSGVPVPSAVPRPTPPARRHPAPSAAAAFGRVDADGTVYVRTAEGERAVGQWPAGDPQAALDFYALRYQGLVAEVDLLAKRVHAGAVSAEEATSAVSKLKTAITSAQAVGDLDGLQARLDALSPAIEERRAARRAERAAKAQEATQQKERIIADVEALAAGNDWRGGHNRLAELLQSWKALPRIDRATDDGLWQRFSAARATYARRRKQHFAELHARQDEVRTAKDAIIAEAETLSTSTSWGATSAAYRDLMTRWKAVGPSSRDLDDALWKRFRAAQDTFFQARDASSAKLDEEFTANAVVKRELLAEAEKLLPVKNPAAARTTFRDLAERWDAAGKVPRSQMRALEDRFKEIEQVVRGAEDDRRGSANSEVRARASETVVKLEVALDKLRVDLSRAEAAGDTRRAAEARAAIEARQAWLDQVRRAESELRA